MRLSENKVENISDGLILNYTKYGWAHFCDYYDLSEDEKREKDLELCQLIADTEEAIRNARRNNY